LVCVIRRSKYTHTHEIYSRSMKLLKWPPACHQLGPPGTHGRPRDSFSAGPQNPGEPHPPFNAIRHTSACLSRACLWLGSLLCDQLWLTVTRAFQIIKELSLGVCHKKAKFVLSFASRCSVGRLARALTVNVIFQIFKVNINAYRDSILARTHLVNELSKFKFYNWKLRLRFHVHKTNIVLGCDGSLLFKPS
jgi:hypothetical protein